MGVGAGLYVYDVVVKSSRLVSHLLMSSCLPSHATDERFGPEMEPGHRVSDFDRVGSGPVTGQCVRPGV